MGKGSRELSLVLDIGLVLPQPRWDEEPRQSLVLFPEKGHHLGKPQMGVRTGFWGLW